MAKNKTSNKIKKGVRNTPVLMIDDKKKNKQKLSVKKLAKSKRKITPKKKDTFNPKRKDIGMSISFPHSVSLTVLPALNLPWDVNSIAIHTARLGGIAFIVFGAILTFMNLQYIGISAELVQNVTEVRQFAVICDTSDANYVQDNTTCNIGSGTYAGGETNVSSVIQSLPYNPFVSGDLIYLGFSTFVVVLGLMLVVFGRNLYRTRKEDSKES